MGRSWRRADVNWWLEIGHTFQLGAQSKVTPDEVLVNCLLDFTIFLEQFKATGVVPSLHACATLIRAYGHARRLDRAWILWRERPKTTDIEHKTAKKHEKSQALETAQEDAQAILDEDPHRAWLLFHHHRGA